jgi:hypothetical protein
VQVLNRSLDWEDAEALATDLRRLDAEIRLDTPARAALRRDLELLRTAYAARALRRALDPAEARALSQWLTAVTLQPGPAGPAGGFGWPGLRAARRGSTLPSRLEGLIGTALVQLAAHGGTELPARCRGVRRGRLACFQADDEAAFAAQAGLQDLLAGGGWSQCPRLVAAPRGAQYCSKACSNAAFVLRKGRDEPRYFAAKQKRYRVRRTRPQPEPRTSPFMFVD